MLLLVGKVGFIFDSAPEGGGYYACRLTESQSLNTNEVIHYICNNLGIGLKRTLVSEHFNKTAVGVVGGYLAVMYYRIIKQCERVSAAPPAGSIGGITSVSRPENRRL